MNFKSNIQIPQSIQSPNHGNKLKKTRQSEPNLFFQQHNFNSAKKTKEQPQHLPRKLTKQPRTSETLIGGITNDAFSSPKHQAETTKKMFTSPAHNLESKKMVKSTSTALFQAESQPTKHFNKQQRLNVPTKFKKNHIQDSKQALCKIQELLINHTMSMNNIKQKKQAERLIPKTTKSPRFSQHIFPQNEFMIAAKRKENESYGNEKRSNGNQQEQAQILKETVSTHSSLKNSRQMKISEFQIGKELGKGKFGTVKIVRHKKTGMIFSLKSIKKSIVKKQQIIGQLIKEIKIQSYLNHSNIIKLYSIFDDAQHIYLLLEICSDGNLYHYMQRKGKIQQKQTIQILNNVCEGVAELHLHCIIHRDLKPQNIVLHNGMAKICDFGWSTQIKDQLRETFCGTPLYVSPELMSGNSYDEKIDLWAIGVLGYEMMTGRIPFDIKSQKDLSKIVTSKIVYPKSMSQNAISFLEVLLQRDPNKRKDILQVLQHPFLKSNKKH